MRKSGEKKFMMGENHMEGKEDLIGSCCTDSRGAEKVYLNLISLGKVN